MFTPINTQFSCYQTTEHYQPPIC